MPWRQLPEKYSMSVPDMGGALTNGWSLSVRTGRECGYKFKILGRVWVEAEDSAQELFSPAAQILQALWGRLTSFRNVFSQALKIKKKENFKKILNNPSECQKMLT